MSVSMNAILEELSLQDGVLKVMQEEEAIGILCTKENPNDHSYEAVLITAGRNGDLIHESYKRKTEALGGQLEVGWTKDPEKIAEWAREELRLLSLRKKLENLADKFPREWALVWEVPNIKRFTINVLTRGAKRELIQSNVYFNTEQAAKMARDIYFTKNLDSMDAEIAERRTLI